LSEDILLQVKDLKTYFYSEEGVSKAVDGVSFDVNIGEILGVVGESGCGKSVTALSIMRLIHDPPGRIEGGQILFEGKNLLELDLDDMTKIRGNDISMIFQEPMAYLNPVFTIGDQISEAIRTHYKVSKKEAICRTVEMLKKVNIPLPEQRIHEYPHQLSGGMSQRVLIAMALICNPKLLIADEPTTALDVTIQAQILDLLNELKSNFNMAIILITHNMGIIAEMANRVIVMYAGKIVECADVRSLFENLRHPYTYGLFNSIPKLNSEVERLTTISGMIPSASKFPEGCRYHTRCPLAYKKCSEEEPVLVDYGGGHMVSCWLSREEIDQFKKSGVPCK